MYETLVRYDATDYALENLLQGPVSKALDIPSNVVWGSQGGATFSALRGDFMKPCTEMGKII